MRHKTQSLAITPPLSPLLKRDAPRTIMHSRLLPHLCWQCPSGVVDLSAFSRTSKTWTVECLPPYSGPPTTPVQTERI